MRILFLVPRYPYPPNRGDILRYYNFAQRLAAAGHEIDVLSFVHGAQPWGLPDGIFSHLNTVPLSPRAAWLRMALSLPTRRPLQVARFSSRKMQQKLDQLLETGPGYDMVYAFHLRMAQFIRPEYPIYKLLDMTDSMTLFMRRMLRHTPWYLRPILWRELAAISRYEAKAMEKFDECWLISEVDRKALPGEQRASVKIVPNGVDTTYYKPGDTNIRLGDANILFVGYMGIESIDSVLYFYHSIYPRVRARISEATFTVVGADPPAKVRKLSRDPNVRVLGYVEDIRTAYRSAAILVAPVRFSVGVQNKVLEAMAMELPVVSSTFGNEGIGGVDGREIFVEDDPERFARRVVELLRNPALRSEIGTNARKLVEQRFTWDAVVAQVENIENRLSRQSV